MKARYDNIFLGDRAREDYGDLREFANNILANGLLQPLGVREVDDADRADPEYKGQEFALMYGGRRYRAITEHLIAVDPDFQEIEVKNFGTVSPIRRLIIEGIENFWRKDMSFVEKTKLVDQIFTLYRLEDPKITKSQVAMEMGVNLSELSRDLATAAAIKERPALAQSGSRKAVLNAARVADQLSARAQRSSEDKTMLDRAKLGQRLVTADMRQWLRQRPDESANVTVVDFPYGQNIFSTGLKRIPRSDRPDTVLSQFDDSPEYALDLMADAVPEICRSTRVTGWVLAFMNSENRQFLKDLFGDVCAEHFDYRAGPGKKQCFHAERAGKKSAGKCRFHTPELLDWIWVRPNSPNPPRYPQLHAKNLYEFIIVVNRGKALLEKPCTNVLIHDVELGNERVHVNQKPVALYKDLFSRTTVIGDVVVDPAFGSGKSMEAAGSMGRGFYGCDINPGNLDVAVGNVAKSLVFTGEEGEKQAATRYLKDREREVEGVDDFSEAEPSIVVRTEREVSEGDLLFYVDDIGKAQDPGSKESYYLCNVRNALHVFASKRAETQEEAYSQASELVDELNMFVEAGLLDAKTAEWKDYLDTKRFVESNGKGGKVEGLPSLRD